MNAVIFCSTVMLWGFSWYAIAVQAAYAPPLAAVLHRIGLAAVLMMAAMLMLGAARRRPRRTHLLFAGQGFCLFGANFVLFYAASSYVSSGLLALCLACACFWNAGLARVLFGQPVGRRQIGGAALGVAGLGLLLGDSLTLGGEAWPGLALAIAASVLFSLGNMASIAIRQAGAAQIEGVAWGMLYGAAGLGLAALINGDPLHLPLDTPNLLALGYLVVFASAVAFSTYLALIARLGAARAAYAMVCAPAVALTVSAMFEAYRPNSAGLVGLVAILAGAALSLSGASRPASTPPRSPAAASSTAG